MCVSISSSVDWTVYNSFTNLQRFHWSIVCYVTAVVRNTKLMLLMFSYDKINILMWYIIAGIGLEKVVESASKVLKFPQSQTVATLVSVDWCWVTSPGHAMTSLTVWVVWMCPAVNKTASAVSFHLLMTLARYAALCQRRRAEMLVHRRPCHMGLLSPWRWCLSVVHVL